MLVYEKLLKVSKDLAHGLTKFFDWCDDEIPCFHMIEAVQMFSIMVANMSTFEHSAFLQDEKDKKIQDLYDELQRERERSAAIQQQIHMILKDLEEHAELMSSRVEDIVESLKEMEMGD